MAEDKKAFQRSMVEKEIVETEKQFGEDLKLLQKVQVSSLIYFLIAPSQLTIIVSSNSSRQKNRDKWRHPEGFLGVSFIPFFYLCFLVNLAVSFFIRSLGSVPSEILSRSFPHFLPFYSVFFLNVFLFRTLMLYLK